MPVVFEDDNKNNPFLPTTPTQSAFGVDVSATPKQLDDASFAEQFHAGFNRENYYFRSYEQSQGDRTSVEIAQDANTDPMTKMKALEQLQTFDPQQYIRPGDEPFIDYYGSAANENDIQVIQKRIDNELKLREIVDNGGIGAWTGMMAGAIADPITLIPAFGQFAKAKTLYKIGGLVAGNVAADGIHEFINYKTDKTYHPEQLGYAIAGSALINGVFGGFAGRKLAKLRKAQDNADKFTQAVIDDLADIGQSMDLNAQPRSVGAAMAGEDWNLKADDLLKKLHLGMASGVDDKRAFFIPNNLLGALSNSRVVRRFTGTLFENNFYYKENIAGKALPLSAEGRLQKAKAAIVDVHYKMKDIYERYARDTSNPMPRDEFNKLVARTIREGAEDNPYANQAARLVRKNIYEPALAELKKIGKLMDVEGDAKYVNRVWDRTKVIAGRPQLRKILADYYATQPGAKGIEYKDLEAAAEDTIQNILGGNIIGGNSFTLQKATTGTPLKRRALDIEDRLIEDYLVNDIDVLINRYVDATSRELEKHRFLTQNGWDTLGDVEDAIRNEYTALRANVTDAAQQAKLNKEEQEAIAFVQDSYNRVFGASEKKKFDNEIAATQKLMTLAKLGGVLISSLGDIARIHQQFGLAGLGNGFKLFLRRATWGAKRHDYERIGALTERVLNERYNYWAGIEPNDSMGIIGRVIDKVYKGFGKVSMIAPWTEGVKTMALYATEHSILKAATKKTLSKREIEELAHWGISSDMLPRIAEQYKKYGYKDRGLFVSGLDEWTDTEALDAYTNALVKASINVINTPTKGTLPRVFDSALGRLVMQFKSFLPTSHVQTLIPMLQSPQQKYLLGTLNMIAIAGIANYAREEQKALIEGKKADHGDWKKIIIEATDRSGVVSLPFEANNMAEKLLHLGIRPLTGTGQATRYRNVNDLGALFGPGLGLTNDVLDVTKDISHGDFGSKDVTKMWRWLPYQNLFWTRWITDQAKEKAKELAGK